MTVTVVLTAVAAGGCGPSDSSVPVSAGAPAAPPVSAAPTLPTLPPVRQRQPERFDAQGCARTGPEQVDCASTASEVDAAAAGTSTQDWRTLNGFVGRYYTTDVSRQALTLLDTSVMVTTVGPWRATGLARSERSDPVAGVRVEAVLSSADGTVLETVGADSPVAPVRPGEPVPFSLVSTTPASAVARVQWSVRPVEGPVGGSRDLELATFWTRPTDAGRRVDLYLYHDPPAPPWPHLVFGSATNTGAGGLDRPSVVLGWLDPSGRVVAVATAAVVDPQGSPITTLGPGQAGDFLAVVDDPTVASQLSPLTPMIWGMSR